MTRKKEKFINSYETKIKEIRKEYYRNITKYSNNEIDRYIIELILKVLPGFLGILLLFTSKHDMKTVIFVIVLSSALSALIDVYFDKNGLDKLKKSKESLPIPYSEAYKKGMNDTWDITRELYKTG